MFKIESLYCILLNKIKSNQIKTIFAGRPGQDRQVAYNFFSSKMIFIVLYLDDSKLKRCHIVVTKLPRIPLPAVEHSRGGTGRTPKTAINDCL